MLCKLKGCRMLCKFFSESFLLIILCLEMFQLEVTLAHGGKHRRGHLDGSLLSAKFSVNDLTLIIQKVKNQTMTAQLMEDDDCIYQGFMVGCTTSRVVVTGCGGEVQSVQIQSMVFGDFIFTTINGVIVPVNSFSQIRRKRESLEDVDYDYDDSFENPEFDDLFPVYLFDGAEVEEKDPPTELVLNINVYLDSEWKNEFGSRKSQSTALGIIKHTEALWQHKSLSTRINIEPNLFSFNTGNQHLLPNKTIYNTKLLEELVGPDKIDGHSTAHIYLTVKVCGDYSRVLGLAKKKTMCGANDGKPRVMAVYKENEIRTAMTVAHEIGHLLGIEHDFIIGNRGHTCGEDRYSGGTVMNYGGKRVNWSKCSNIDFKAYYNRVLSLGSNFCLKEAECPETWFYKGKIQKGCTDAGWLLYVPYKWCPTKAGMNPDTKEVIIPYKREHWKKCTTAPATTTATTNTSAPTTTSAPTITSAPTTTTVKIKEQARVQITEVSCRAAEFPCNNGTCIPKAHHCDGLERHCPDGEDESGCDILW